MTWRVAASSVCVRCVLFAWKLIGIFVYREIVMTVWINCAIGCDLPFEFSNDFRQRGCSWNFDEIESHLLKTLFKYVSVNFSFFAVSVSVSWSDNDIWRQCCFSVASDLLMGKVRFHSTPGHNRIESRTNRPIFLTNSYSKIVSQSMVPSTTANAFTISNVKYSNIPFWLMFIDVIRIWLS